MHDANSCRLFSSDRQPDESDMRRGEPLSAFLDRSTRPALRCARQQIEEWFGRYPREHRWRLRQDLRSRRDAQHQAALFELVLHEVLLRQGFSLAIHPDIPGSANHPDFLVTSPTSERFYLEMAVVTARSQETEGAEHLKVALYNALDDLDSPLFYVMITVHALPKRAPSVRRIKEFLLDKLRQLDADEVLMRVREQGLSVLPEWRYECAGLSVSFRPLPKAPERQGMAGVKPLGAIYEWLPDDPARAIRDKVVGKARRYGQLYLPFALALNVVSRAYDDMDITEALFGYQSPIRMMPLASVQGSPVYTGAWLDRGQWRRARLGAVILSVGPFWTFLRPDYTFVVHHPQPKRPFQANLLALPQFVPGASGYVRVPGASLNSLLGLPDQWPTSNAAQIQTGCT